MAEFNEAQKALQEKIHKERFYTINDSGKTDTFMRVIVMLHSSSEVGLNFFNRKARAKEFDKLMGDLYMDAYYEASEEEKEVYVEEWKTFAERYIHTCIHDKNYSSVAFGLIKMSKKRLYLQMESDFKVILNKYPSEFGKADYIKPFYDIMMAALEVRKPEMMLDDKDEEL